MKVKAVSSFDHGGSRRKGDQFEVSEQVALQLKKKGLVVFAGSADSDSGSSGTSDSGSDSDSSSASDSGSDQPAAKPSKPAAGAKKGAGQK